MMITGVRLGMDERELMENALREAENAGEDVPVGCVIEYGGKIIARARNMRETGEPERIFSHAEMLCMLRAARALGTRRLKGCRLAVTLEPCPMCAGAMILAGIDECVFGAYDPVQGCCGSVYDLPEDDRFYHTVPCSGGVLQERSAAMLKAFFEKRRNQSTGPDPLKKSKKTGWKADKTEENA